ncbi:hypothetical protein HBI56_146800 [Parastagonospora nodorum]|uniref:NmrA-like domain-containing protein n=1 Tax=Phaeosphaeria nodorum (strain SN15 / ATCC MYA-4574 / FGSC 10173) TaxID=321614 RepID=A0A7U2NQR8_PHANO|nr:hypothetical protein HBH56_078050 [Parastagonospora nodorum]QRD06991.1 hypothetical protein JI435_126040 [Parastagonospora nodorum SN15]KAH3923437.1 hypothetical protein HBH54_209900 [Parastagonospora nodorum]KAH3952144.1 hypothetical protein HBH53_050070 [Parastagonospora nodorum]KAH3981775.1 hypothetical protein HBH51_044950 [Parastagonospora nodorum]
MASRAVLITGATGKQGGSVVNALLKANAPFEILALTRNAKSASAQKLLQKSPKIKLVTGDFSAIDDIFLQAKAATSTPIWGIFSVQVPLGSNEEAHGKALIDAALKNDVSHFVYTSVERGPNSDTTPTNVPHFITKHNIEQHLFAKAKGSNMTWTVLRPVAFFDNLMPNFFGKVFTASWLMRLGEETKKMQLIATSDIGEFAAKAFVNADQEEFRDKSISLAGDELTFSEMKAIFEKKTGETLPTTYAWIAGLIQWLAKDFGYMMKWMRRDGFGVDVAGMRKRNPEMKDFETWLETESAWRKN